jgi:hypothetical protein
MARYSFGLIGACVIAPALAFAATPAPRAPIYFPERNDWQHKTPADAGMNAAKLDDAIKSTIAHENPLAKNMVEYLATTFGAREPMDTPIGPTKDRGPAAGLITRHGYIVAVVRWIDTIPSLNDVVGKMIASIDGPEK